MAHPAWAATPRRRPAPSDAEARRKFEEAQAQYGLTNFTEAARLYAEAYRLRPARTALLLYVGDAYKKDWQAHGTLESLRKAIEFFQRYLDLAPPSADPSRATRELEGLRPRLAEEEKRARSQRLESAHGVAAIELVGQLIRERDADGAEVVLARAKSEPGHARTEVAALFRLEAELAAAKGDGARAVAAFRALLALEPGFALPATAEPRSAAAFAEAFRANAGQRLSAQHVPTSAIRRGVPARIRLQIDADPLAMIKAAQVSFRARGAGAWAEARYPSAANMVLSLPAEFVAALEAGSEVEYYVRLLGERDAILLEFGGAEAPFSFAVREPEVKATRPLVAAPQRTAAEPSGALRTAGWAALAGGGGLLTLGVVTSAWGKSLEGDLDKACPAPERICGTAAARNENGRYETLRTLWRVGFIAGGTAVATGALLLWLSPDRPARVGVRLVPFVGWGLGGIVGVF